MTATATKSKSNLLQSLIPVLKESAQTFEHIRDELRQINQKYVEVGPDPSRRRLLEVEHNMWTAYFDQFSSAARPVAQQVSQQIEHGDLTEFDRLELRLRLAQLESAMSAAGTMASNHPSFLNR